jgi:hypothetical protein
MDYLRDNGIVRPQTECTKLSITRLTDNLTNIKPRNWRESTHESGQNSVLENFDLQKLHAGIFY